MTAPPHKLPPQFYSSALLVVHHDGFLEVFSATHADVQIIQCPPFQPGAQGELDCEEFVELTLRPLHQALYRRDMCRATAALWKIRPNHTDRS